MRRVTLGVFLLSLAICSHVRGQPTELTKAEFESITRRGRDYLSKSPHRERIFDQRSTQEDGDIISQIIERESPTRWWNKSMIRTASGSELRESIRVDDQELEKVGNETWREPKRGGNRFTVLADSPERTMDETFHDKGTDVVNGESLRVVESVTRYTYKTDQRRSWGHIQRYWVDKDGRFKKHESRSLENEAAFWQRVITYEYDPTIKIKLPIEPKKC